MLEAWLSIYRAWGLSVEEFRAWPWLGRESTGIRRWVRKRRRAKLRFGKNSGPEYLAWASDG